MSPRPAARRCANCKKPLRAPKPNQRYCKDTKCGLARAAARQRKHQQRAAAPDRLSVDAEQIQLTVDNANRLARQTERVGSDLEEAVLDMRLAEAKALNGPREELAKAVALSLQLAEALAALSGEGGP